jgi:membrane protein implicated in regulation of membrane protease activity
VTSLIVSFLSIAALIAMASIAAKGGRRARATLGVIAIVVAILLLMARAPLGAVAAAIIAVLAIVGVVTAARPRKRRRRRGYARSRSTGSTVRTAVIEMTMAEDGGIEGRVLNGAFAGRTLESMTVAEILDLALQVPETDRRTLTLLTTYLDRMRPGWSSDDKKQPEEDAAPPVGNGSMTRDQAYEVLGLSPGATDDEIEAAYRRLIRRVHPDAGGSTALAAQINAAKVKLGRAS